MHTFVLFHLIPPIRVRIPMYVYFILLFQPFKNKLLDIGLLQTFSTSFCFQSSGIDASFGRLCNHKYDHAPPHTDASTRTHVHKQYIVEITGLYWTAGRNPFFMSIPPGQELSLETEKLSGWCQWSLPRTVRLDGLFRSQTLTGTVAADWDSSFCLRSSVMGVVELRAWLDQL